MGKKKIVNSLDEGLEVEWKSLDKDADIDKTTTCDKNDIVSSSSNTLRAIQNFAKFIASMDDSSPLIDGMHIVSILVQDKWVNLPIPE